MKSALVLSSALVAALALVGAAAPGSVPQTAPLSGPAVGDAAPDFTLRTVDGAQVTLASFRGRTLVLNVWATWCPPCREEMPALIRSHHDLTAAGDVAFLGVDTTEQAPIVRAYAAARALPYPQAIGDKAFDRAYDIGYFPTTFVIDPSGILRARFIDVLSGKRLAELTADAKAGRNAEVRSELQTKIDAILAPDSFVFGDDQEEIVKEVKRASAAIASVDDLADDSDGAHDNPIDLLRTQAEETALRDRAIAALEPIATTADRELQVTLLKADAARDREHWSDALAAYQHAAALDPRNAEAYEGIARAAGRLENYSVGIAADRTLVELRDDVASRVELALMLGSAHRYDDAYAMFDGTTMLAERLAYAHPSNVSAQRAVAWAYLYSGRTHAKGGDVAGARRAFATAAEWADRLPPHDERHDMYVEESQEGLVALGLGGTSATAVSLAPWTGPELPGSIPNTIKYRLIVSAAAGKQVQLHTSDVPRGWVASFCSDRVCAPFQVSVQVPESGVKVIEFQLVPPGAGKSPAHVRVFASDGSTTASATT